ncbi:hypothetical protein Zmor_015331 [Zophobas morio]|uniref:Larval cuticle protein 16/17 n=2 Tax=Zophobas morio TaxID=2755281 RepID=A0AA38MH41_9CUCU|nr:hypothetical protein Zmor_015331 [Zophobas morio]
MTFFCIGIGKPDSEDNIKYIMDVAITHFGFRDTKDLNLPSKQDTENSHPHSFNLTNDGSGNYYFQFDTADIERFEIGELKNAGTENEIQVVRGQYLDRSVNEDGALVVRKIGYIADENGYRPFLISIQFLLSVADTPGGPKGPKSDISSAALGSLVGGGLG